MKRMAYVWFGLTVLSMTLTACGYSVPAIPPAVPQASRTAPVGSMGPSGSVAKPRTVTTTAAATGSAPFGIAARTSLSGRTAAATLSATRAEATEEAVLSVIQLMVGERLLDVELYRNDTARALMERLPMTLDMEELNGNEKYVYLTDRLPTKAGQPPTIHAGDLMLYGDDCLVLFYESFTTAYRYTPLGRVRQAEGLAAALGGGHVRVTLRLV